MKSVIRFWSVYLLAFVFFTSPLLAEEPSNGGKLTAPAEVVVGSQFQVKWDGPSNKTDFVSIDDPNAKNDRQYGSSYGYPAKRNPLKLRAPTEPGSYVIRYHLGKSYAVIAAIPLKVTDATATLEAPESAALGTQITVNWSGPGNHDDFISIDPINSNDRVYGKQYNYPRRSNPLKLQVPDIPGEYEIRYHLSKSYRVLGTTKLLVTDVEASLTVPKKAEAGGEVTVSWTGPAATQDFISIDPSGSEDRVYGKQYNYPRRGNPLIIRVPDKPGQYEVRYHLARTYRVIATTPLLVTSVKATLHAPKAVAAGSQFTVEWAGPGYHGDFISIDTVDAKEGEYGNYSRIKEQGKAVSIAAPDDIGDYQLRYHLKGSYRVLGTTPLQVTPPKPARLIAPQTVETREKFKVSWEGPGNHYDLISILPPDTEDQTRGNNYSYINRGNPVRIQAPKIAGKYELRYLSGQKFYTLAKQTITVKQGTRPGTLRVISKTQTSKSQTNFGAIELVLDASGSMLQKLNNIRRIELARRALIKLINNVLPAGTSFALRVFGHQEVDTCRTDLEIPLGPLDKRAAVTKIQSIQAKNLAKTPLADSLLHIKKDLAETEGSALVILVTDGEETCDGDPQAAIEHLQHAGFDIRVNIIGFAIGELDLKEEFEAWARLGKGRYFDAPNADELNQAVQQSLQVQYEVRQGKQLMQAGVVNGDAIELKPGEYQVQLRTTSAQDLGTVIIEAEKESEISF